MSVMRAGRRAPDLVSLGSGPRRWLARDERGLVLALVVLTGLCALAINLFTPVTGSVFMVPLLIGSMVLSPRKIPAFVLLVVFLLTLVTVLDSSEGNVQRRLFNLVLVALMGALTILLAQRRTALGVAGWRGESMLVDLRERLARQGELPQLPADWHAEVALASAEGATFAGDFMVTWLAEEERRLDIAVVDVSGKGVHAGTRSLLLSGAFGGLLGALPPEEFLPAANRFLLQQDWPEGFATAVHVAIDLDTGVFEARYAGHPPVVQLQAGSGRWLIHDTVEGPVLGVLATGEFGCLRGTLARGDALLLYTDGLVERAHRDLSLGIDRLVGEGERLVRRGFHGAARTLVRELASDDDDCALVLLQRRAVGGVMGRAD